MHGQASRKARRRQAGRQPAKRPKPLPHKGSRWECGQKWMEEERIAGLKQGRAEKVKCPAACSVCVGGWGGGGAQREVLARDGRNHSANPLPGLAQYCHRSPKDVLLAMCSGPLQQASCPGSWFPVFPAGPGTRIHILLGRCSVTRCHWATPPDPQTGSFTRPRPHSY